MSTVAEDVRQIREAIYGREVREAIADGIEHCYSDVSGGVTTANTAAAAADAAAQRANTAAAGAEGIPGTASLEDVNNLKSTLSDNITKNNISLTDIIYGNKQIVSAISEAYLYTNIPFEFKKNTLYKIKLTRSEPSIQSFNVSTSNEYIYVDSHVGNMISGQDVTVVSFVASANASHLRIEEAGSAGITYTAEIETEVLTNMFSNSKEAIRSLTDPIYRNKFQGIVANVLNLYTDLPYNFVRGFCYRITVEISIDAPEDILLGMHNGSIYVHDNISVIKKGTRSTVFNYVPIDNATKIVAKLIKNINFDYTYSIDTEIVSDIEMCAESQMMEFALSTAKYAKGWIRYSNGEFVGSEATMTYVLQRKLFPKYIKAFLTSDTDVLCAIAFYRTNDISTEGYLKDSSVDFLTGDHNNGAWYSAKVPDDCKIITITTKKPSGTIPKPILLHPYINDTNGAEYVYKPCYDHLFVNYTGNDIVIPHESLYHIRISRLLGFNMIELNVAKTVDNVYVVNHFSRGKFGGYFEHVDGQTDISEIAVSSVTWAWIVENVRYKSQIGKYRTRPERLEEALVECKQQGLTPFIQAEESGVIAIADQYMGEGNYVAYNATRILCPKAPIFRGENFTDKNEILNYCHEYGRPFIYSLLNVDDFTESELRDIVKTLHDNGYKIATSYNDVKWSKLQAIGFDLNGTQLLMNRINNGNLYNYESIFGFGNFTYTNATENNGELIFSDDGKIEPNIQDATYELCGIDVEVSFSGKIHVQAIGEFWGAEYINDTESIVYVSTPIVNGSPKVAITCYSGTIIKDIKYKASIL